MNKKKFLEDNRCIEYLLSFSFLLLFAFVCRGSHPFSKHHLEHQPAGNIKVDKIVIIKSKRTLQLWYKDQSIKTYKVALGKNPSGPKQFEGDFRTPEGLYYIDDKNPNSKYHKSLGISYPSAKDLRNARKQGRKPGGQIRIHGLSKSLSWLGRLHLLVDWTRGCIAVTNEEIDELYQIIEVGTPVEIKP